MCTNYIIRTTPNECLTNPLPELITVEKTARGKYRAYVFKPEGEGKASWYTVEITKHKGAYSYFVYHSGTKLYYTGSNINCTSCTLRELASAAVTGSTPNNWQKYHPTPAKQHLVKKDN